MQTKIGNLQDIGDGAKIICDGGLVAFPTETVYGLGADAFNKDAIDSIFIAKGRPQDNPLIVHIAKIEDIYKVAINVPQIALDLFKTFSPGPLTIVLQKSEKLPLNTTGGLQTVGIRIPNHPIALSLIEKSGTALAAPSANTSSRISPTEAIHVYEDMQGKIPLIIDGGSCTIGLESTVLDLTTDIPTILRPGAITAEMLAVHLKQVKNHMGEVKVAHAPGMKYKHYSPICECVSASNLQSALEKYDNILSSGGQPVIIGRLSYVSKCGSRNVFNLGEAVQDLNNKIYSALRFSEKEYNYIIIELLPQEEKFNAINNRLSKSTGGKII